MPESVSASTQLTSVLLTSNDREGEVDARDWHDRITVWTRIRTLDYPRANHVRVEAAFYPD